jgi:flavin reductase (DIM6/NTAB) family NADH-FMN oxidoreductase RutF
VVGSLGPDGRLKFLSAASNRYVIFGQVVGVHIDERFIKDGLLDTAAMRPIARAGYHDYVVATADTRFAIDRPAGGDQR